jgi:hypothetical protein
MGDGVACSLSVGEPRVKSLYMRFGRAQRRSWSNAHREHVVLGGNSDHQDFIAIAVVLPPQAHDVVGNCDFLEHFGKPTEGDEIGVKSRDKDGVLEVNDGPCAVLILEFYTG